ncbi:MAG: bifunctional phosphopantothenoylcysteine decarboxylase/phosphopantothenate--cysteine ligase CoaBC [Actinobacteria bacterium]|nr:bifunctional phosphopantothenoylcysteine decarboxylase/phosphopantothenate--cysteine ligase CoaBC [Actinomycetota bacterium]
MLENKKVLLGVTGGIAAYKSAEIARLLIRSGATVQVVMTEAATKFITPFTFKAITNKEVITSLFDENSDPITHISAAKKADIILIAPATANIIAKIANGIADDALSTIVLASSAPMIFAPAMNTQMYLNPETQENISKLKRKGFEIIEPETGELACGDEGIGRLASIDEIIESVISEVNRKDDLKGKTIIVTAGGTREPIDSLRYITNRSSGKMGYAIAGEAAKRGAKVILISAPANLIPPSRAEFVEIETASELKVEIDKYFSESDALIMSAAIADFSPVQKIEGKIKKDGKIRTLELKENPDILKELGRNKKQQILTGFALEDKNLIENAKKKLEEKNLDFIVANDISVIGSDFNQIAIIDKNGDIKEFPEMSKTETARIIIDYLVDKLGDR